MVSWEELKLDEFVEMREDAKERLRRGEDLTADQFMRLDVKLLYLEIILEHVRGIQ